MEACAEHIFWHCVADLVQSMKQMVEKDYRELQDVRDVLNNSRTEYWNLEPGFLGSGSPKENIFNKDSLRSRIKSKFSYAAFSEKDVMEIIKAIDRACQGTRDYHVNLKKRPEMHFIFHKDLEGSLKEEKRNFLWKLHPVSYLPKSVFLALKIYAYFEEEREIDYDYF